MAYALVGTIGAVSTGSSGAAVTPAWGTSESRTAGHLLICFVAVNGSATQPTTPSGWSLAKFQAGTSCSATIFYKIAAGSDAAPTIAAITSGVISAQLAEYSGNVGSSPVDQAGSSSGTGNLSVTTTTADQLTGELLLSANTAFYSRAATESLSDTFNNGATATSTTNNSTSTADHYCFSYGITTGNSSADTNTAAAGSTHQTGGAAVLVSFKVSVPITKTQTATARIQATVTKTQTARAAIAPTPNPYVRENLEFIGAFGSGTSHSVTLSSGASAGDLIVLLGMETTSAANLSSVTDSKGNTWTIGAQSDINQHTFQAWTLQDVGTLASGDTVTLHWSASIVPSIAVLIEEFTGIAASPQDQTAIANFNLAGTRSAGTTGTTTQAKELIVAGFGLTSQETVAITPGTGYLNFPSDPGNTLNGSLEGEWTTVSAVGTYSPTNSGNTNSGDGVTVTYKLAVAQSTKTQTAIARIQATGTKTQSAVARIQNTVSKTQSAVARIQQVGLTKTQTAVARIVNTETHTQTAVARILRTGLTKTQSSVARIQVTGLTKTQSAIARIGLLGTKAQTAVARILNTGMSHTQSAVARIQKTGLTKTQTAVGRIQTTLTKTQTSVSRVQVVGLTATQTATAHIAGGKTFTQTATAHILPVPIDNFNRADGPLGSNWSFWALGANANDGQITSNEGNWSAPAADYWNHNTFGPDCTVGVDLDVWTLCQLGLRLVNPGTLATSTGYMCSISLTGGFAKFFRIDNGVATNLATHSGFTFHNGDHLEVNATGSTFTLSQNGTAITSWTDTTYDTAGYVGVSQSTGVNNLYAWPVAQTFGSFTQTAIARIAVVGTNVQTAIARILRSGLTKTQTAVARIQRVGLTKTQTSIARIQVTGTKTQPAVARIQNTGMSKTQTATAHIVTAGTGTHSQTAVARIQVVGLTHTQSAIARIAKSFTKTQTSIARIQKTGQTKLQTAIARVLKTGLSKTQTSIARISKPGLTKTQTSVARIQVAGRTKTQTSVGRIKVVGLTKTQTATAHITTAFVASKTQTAVSRIQVVGLLKSLTAVARIQVTPNLTQTSTARITGTYTVTQTATAHIVRIGPTYVDRPLGSQIHSGSVTDTWYQLFIDKPVGSPRGDAWITPVPNL